MQVVNRKSNVQLVIIVDNQHPPASVFTEPGDRKQATDYNDAKTIRISIVKVII